MDVGTRHSARAYRALTLEDQTRVCFRAVFFGDALSERARDRIGLKALSREPLAIRLRFRYRLSGNSHPGSPRTLAQTWHKPWGFYWLKSPRSRETIHVHVLERQGRLDTNVKILRYVDS